MSELLKVYGVALKSRLLLGTSKYPSLDVMAKSVGAAGAEVVTVSVRRELAQFREGQEFWRIIRELGVRVLPNTAGCYTVKEAVTTAQMAREIFDTAWIKLEVIGDQGTFAPDVFGTVEAARILSDDGFDVFPYTTEDLIVCDRLLEAGCKVLMPWGAPIGSGKGLNNPFGLRVLAGAPSRGSADRRRRRRPAVARRCGDGARLRRGVAQHRRRHGRRSRRDGGGVPPGDRSGRRRAPRRPDAA